MNTKKLIVSLVGVLILIGGIAVGVFLVKQNQQFREKAAPATSFIISPVQQSKTAGGSVSIDVVMNTGSNQVVALDIALSFDPQGLDIISITQGSAISNFNNELKKQIDPSGRILYSAYTSDRTKAVSGSGLSVLTIMGKVRDSASQGSYRISFLSQSSVGGLEEGGANLLTNTTPGSVNVGGGETTPTPTSSPTATPTATPTSNGQATPTPTPTNVNSTPTPTPVYTPTPGSGGTSINTPTPISTAFPVPESGISYPSIIMAGVGVFLLTAVVLFFN